MSSKFKIVIVDDETERAKRWAGRIEANVSPERLPVGFDGISITVLEKTEAVGLVECVEARQALVRSNGDPFDGTINCELDAVDLLIADYDLQDLSTDRGWSTGLQLTVLARAFTRVRGIALVNQFAINSFDLTMRQAVESRADFDIGSEQVANPALWSADRAGFAPWRWMRGLMHSSVLMGQRIDWVMARLDQPVLQALGLSHVDDGASGIYVESTVWRHLGSGQITFRELASQGQFLAVKDREHIQNLEESSARVAASIVSNWFDHWLVPSEDALVDLPHLASLSPWLLKGFHLEESWRSISGESTTEAFEPVVAGSTYAGFPLARPCVNFRLLNSSPDASEPAGFTYEQVPDFVFCENTSKFEPFGDASSFISDLPGNPQRYVSLKATGEGEFDPSLVSYEPSVRLAL